MFAEMSDSREKTTLLVLFVAGLIVRLIYFIEYKSLIEFLHPSVDALYHHLTAKAIAAGGLISAEPFFRTPLYNYFLGFIYWLTNDSIALARFIQLVIGTATAPLVYLIAKEVFDRRVALVAAILVLFTGDIVYFEGELVLEATANWLVLATLLCLAIYSRSKSLPGLLCAGLLTGLAIIDRPNTAMLIPAAILILWKLTEKNLRLKHAASFAGVMLIPIMLVLLHNVTRTEPAFTIATQGGINFYIGNNSEADGVSAVMPGKLGSSWQYSDIEYLAEATEGRQLSSSEVSAHYFDKGMDFVFSHPLEWLKLSIKKLYLLFSGEDISNNRNLPAFKEEVFLFQVLPIGMGILAPLGLIGMFAARRSKLAAAMMLFVVLYALSFVAFFVNSRFRLPLLPLLAIFSAFTLVAVFEKFKSRSFRPVIAGAAAVIVLAVTLNANLYRIQFDNRSQALFNKGNQYLEASDFQRAISYYYQSLENPPAPPQVHLNLGIAFLKLGEQDSAWNHFLIEDSLSNGSAEALNNLAYLYRQAGQPHEAATAAAAALGEKPYLSEARLNYWYALRESGEIDSVYRMAKTLSQSRALELNEKFILAVSAVDLRHLQEADSLLHEVAEEISKKELPGYREASGAGPGSTNLVPAVFESRVLYNLGVTKAGLGQIDSAIVYLGKAVDSDPNLAEGWINLGSAYFAKRNFSSAIQAFERAIRLNENSEIVWFNLALAHAALGEISTARESATKALAIKPDFQPAIALIKQLETLQK